MKSLFRRLIFSFFLMVTVIFIAGCVEQTTQSTTTNLTTSSGTTTSTISSSTTTTSSTNSTTTTTSTSTTNTTTTTTTQAQEEFDNLDELVLSIDRLDNVVIEVDFEKIFSETNQDLPQPVFAPRRYFPGIGTQRILTSGNEDEIYDPEDYLEHAYWKNYFYHKDLYNEPLLEGGMYQITTMLNSYNNQALNNLYDVSDGVFSSANAEVDWAVDNITVMNTWIVTYDLHKYLLDYDSEKDIVNLYHIWYQDDWGLTSYNKISVYYNDKGEEVIEKWQTEVYSKGDYDGATVYFNTVASRDFNYYCIWLDEFSQPSDTHHFRGINVNKDGKYEYYDNDYSVVSGDAGWYTISHQIDRLSGEIVVPTPPTIETFNPTGDSNVVTIYQGWENYHVKLYLPAFDGLEAILIQEGGMIQQNQDDLATRDWLVSGGYALMPDQFVYNNDGTYWTTGFKTAAGSFLSTDPIWNDSVGIRMVDLRISAEGERAYSSYYKYFGSLELDIFADSIDEATAVLSDYLSHVGLSYKYGLSSDLFSELSDVYSNVEELAGNIQITNEVMKNPYHIYQSVEEYDNTLSYIYEYTFLDQKLEDMLSEFDQIAFGDMPNTIDITSFALVNITSNFTGELSFSEGQIDSSNLDVTLPQSALLRTTMEYSLYYAFGVGNKLNVFGSEPAQTYQGSPLHFNTGSLISLPSEMVDGEYALMMFIAKPTELGYVRVSEAIQAPFTSFEPTEIIVENAETGINTVFQLVYLNGHAYLNVLSLDIQAPDVTLHNFMAIFRGETTIPYPIVIEGLTTNSTLLTLIDRVSDNRDGELRYGLDNFMVDGSSGLLPEDPLHSGIYSFMVEDEAGNQTVVTFEIVITYEVVFFDEETELSRMTVVEGEAASTEAVPSKVGYTFAGWSEEFLQVFDNLNVYATYTINTHSISYMIDDIQYQVVNDIEYGSVIALIEAPVREGFVFSGWASVPDTMPDEDIVITGTFTAE